MLSWVSNNYLCSIIQIQSTMNSNNCYNDWMYNQQDYNTESLDEAMMVAYHKTNGEVILINLIERYAWRIVDTDRKLVHWNRKDIDYIQVLKLHDHHHALSRRAPYDFIIGKYEHGIAKVSWTLYPEGMYYTSDQGYAVEFNEEIVIHALIDSKARVIVPFQPMDQHQENCYRENFARLVRQMLKTFF